MTEQLTSQQKIIQYLLMFDPNDPNFRNVPEYKTQQWITQLGHDLKSLFNNNLYTKMYYNELGIIEIE